MAAVLHWEGYGSEGLEDALAAYDRAMIETGIYRGRQVPVPGRPDEVENYGWMEHSARRVAQAARTDLREVLERQGFALR
jgi:hypothetical protein